MKGSKFRKKYNGLKQIGLDQLDKNTIKRVVGYQRQEDLKKSNL